MGVSIRCMVYIVILLIFFVLLLITRCGIDSELHNVSVTYTCTFKTSSLLITRGANCFSRPPTCIRTPANMLAGACTPEHSHNNHYIGKDRFSLFYSLYSRFLSGIGALLSSSTLLSLAISRRFGRRGEVQRGPMQFILLSD